MRSKNSSTKRWMFLGLLVAIGLSFGLGCAKLGEAQKTPEPAAEPKPMDDEADLAKDSKADMAPAPAKMAMAMEKKEAEEESVGAKGSGGGEGDGKAKPKEPKTWKKARVTANTSRLMIGDREELPIRGMQVHAQVDGFRARVLIDFYFFNDRDQQFEGTFKLRLPEGAAPYFLAFGQSTWQAENKPSEAPRYDPEEEARKRGFAPEDIVAQRADAWQEPKVARMVPKEKAARAYADTVRRATDPALMEWSGAGVFSARIFPITPRRLHRVVVGYDMDLIPIGPDLEFALPLPKDLPSAVIDLDVAPLKGPELRIEPANKGKKVNGRLHFRFENPKAEQIAVRIAPANRVALAGGDESGSFFAMPLTPQLPRAASDAIAPRAVFLLDTSMSANPDKFGIWVALLKRILAKNRPTLKQFAVLFFNVETHWYQEAFLDNTEANVAALERVLNELALEGATDLGAALRQAVRPDFIKAKGGLRYDLFLLSDGAATWGQDDPYMLSTLLTRAGPGALFAYRTGMSGGDDRMLNHLARESGGAVFAVMGESEVEAAADAHTLRPWEIRRVALAGGEDLILAGRPRFAFPGQRLILAGRGKPAEGGRVVLHLRQGQTERALELPMDQVLASDLAPRIYGQMAVDQLEDFLDVTADAAGAYARHFRVTGKSTSLLMLESEEDYQRFNIVPKDDAGLVRAKQVGHLLAAALDTLTQLLGDARFAMQRTLERLKTAPGVDLQLAPEVVKLVGDLPKQLFEVATPRLICKKRDAEGLPPKVFSMLRERKPEYDAMSAEAERRLKSLGPADALKALSSMVEASPGDGVLARDVGFSAMEWGLPAHAYHLFRRVAAARPHEPQTYRALALSLAAQGTLDLAVLYFEIGLAGQWDSRFGEFRRILLLDYLRFLTGLGKDFRGLHPMTAAFAAKRRDQLKQEIGITRADVLVSVTWNTDNTDVDLHVIEPSGEECYYSHPETASGGRLTQDVTQGYGPEMYLLPKAPKGQYKVRVHYFASDSNRASARTKVYATVYRKWGQPGETVTRKVVSLAYGKEDHDIALIEVP